MHVSPSTRSRVAAGALICAALSVSLAACGSSHPSTSADKTTTTTKSTTATTTTVPGANLTPTFVPLRNAHADVSLAGACTQNSSGAWVLKGSIVNPAAKPIGFQLVVDFVHEPGSTVLATKIVNVPAVAPSKTVPWQASWNYSGKDVSCVVRQAQTVSK